eukprot:TRINITY_DN9060_c0_g1_i1.p1 TRINITY_DN9060_c0_g1~~TRINITY_DN9060_c0_g1_i1.p1  ORF type:complete len:474 (+),score=46.05 TRINITY_DN9060_c0_g1_i1:106-1422(+)
MSASNTALLAVIMPTQIKVITGNKPTAALATITGFGFLFSVISQLFIGPLMDKWTFNTNGKKLPWLVGSGCISIFCFGVLIAFGVNLSLSFYGSLWVIGTSSAEVSYVAFLSMWPEYVSEKNYGSVSGWTGASIFIGSLLGVVLAGVVPSSSPLLLSLTFTATSISGLLLAIGSVYERPLISNSQPSPLENIPFSLQLFICITKQWMVPFRESVDFRWAWCYKFLNQLGWLMVLKSFGFYMILDCVVKPNVVFGREVDDGTLVLLFLITALISAASVSNISGILADKYGRKRMVYTASLFQIIGSLLLSNMGVVEQGAIKLLLYSVVFGIGIGSYVSVDFALGMECFPSVDNYARDISIWGLATTIPGVICLPLVGFILENGNQAGSGVALPNLGYFLIFAICSVLVLISTLLVSRISVGNPPSKTHHSGQNNMVKFI